MCLATAAVLASAAGSVGGGIAAGNAANYQAQVAKNNSTIATQNARYTAAAGSAQVEQQGLKARAQNANVKVGAAANGLDVNSGSALDVETSQRELGALDTATVANRAASAVAGYQDQAENFSAQSKLDSSEAPWDYTGGLLKGFGTVAGELPKTPWGSSLLSGNPSLPSQHAWMGGNENGTPLGDI